MVHGKAHHRAVDYSDSESQTLGKPALKRQKVEKIDDIDMEGVPYNPRRNTHLKGRKRFSADFADIQEACASGLVLHGLKLKKIHPGEDEGSIEVVIENRGKHVLSATLLVSDTSEYPGSHSLFCYSPDAELPSIQRIFDEAAEDAPRTIGDTISKMMASLSRIIGSAPMHCETVTDDEDVQSSAADYDVYDEYDDIESIPIEANSIKANLQKDFVDIVASNYRPGFTRLGGDDFIVSVSLPVITLSNSIPPHALMAWDRRLLSCSQHLTLLISGFHGLYSVLENDVSYTNSAKRLGVSLGFKVGLSQRYKPGTEQVLETVRKHGLITHDAEDDVLMQANWAAMQQRYERSDDLDEDEPTPAEAAPVEEEVVEIDEGRFDGFSLSSSLESLMDQSFLKIVQLRRRFGLGWAGAELLHSEIEISQRLDEDVLKMKHDKILQADRDERKIEATTLPHDPLLGLKAEEPFNLPLTAFCYLVRRLSLCTQFCIVCHNKLTFDYDALKPYVCDSKLCSYQYYSLNRGPSLEYEIIHNPLTVDLLVSLAYISASDGAMDEPLPLGLGLRVPPPAKSTSSSEKSSFTQPSLYYINNPTSPAGSIPIVPKKINISEDGLCEFDELDRSQMRRCIANLISTLPSIDEMKKHLEKKVKAGKSKPRLKDIDSNVLPAAWSILRWCVASCTAHVEAITSGEELIKNLDPTWTQFRFTVGAPDAEAKFKKAIDTAVETDANAKVYPVLYAFHGSPLKNWHSIIRHGLWYKTVSHGRAFGDGVYLAKDASTSMGYFAASGTSWKKSKTGPMNCMALTEVVNLPSEFVSSNPHYVIKDTHWIMCRYLLVRGANADGSEASTAAVSKKKAKIPFVKLDPRHQTSVNLKVIQIPDPAFQVESLLAARKADYVHEDLDEEDLAIFQLDSSKSPQHIECDYDDDDDYFVPVASSSSKNNSRAQRPKDDWKHNAEWVVSILKNLMPPPIQSSPSASVAIQRELKSMLKEQDLAPNLRDLGWYMPPDLIGDNLYQWFVEMHSLDPALPIAKDMKDKQLNSIVMEIRFPPAFPNSPPFFRIVSPRFLPFINGGGGHVTGGGSICMDLLTSDGWLPSYSISAVLMQIRLAISNLEPRPARLAYDWNRPYAVSESLAGYKRAAATHGWTLPPGLDRLVR